MEDKKCSNCKKTKQISEFKNNQKTCIKCRDSYKRSIEKNKCNMHGKYYNCSECNAIEHLANKARSVTSQVLTKYKNPEKGPKYIGCNVDEFKQHIESLFREGMNWSNYGEIWEIDHCIPLKYNNPTIKEVMERLDYLNTQPLFINENKKKKNTEITIYLSPI